MYRRSIIVFILFLVFAFPAFSQQECFSMKPSAISADLCVVSVLHYNAEGQSKKGELIVNKAIAKDVEAIFKELYRMKFPIERMEPMSVYNNDDETSMRHNNTSAYCHRVVKGSNKLSKHARGLAIDINPLYNPCFKPDPKSKTGYKPGSLQPANAQKYANRKVNYPYTITPAVVALFKKHGFRWGGDWRTKKDYQHFER